MEIQESRDKFVSYGYGNSDVVATSFMASGGGEINGRDKAGLEVMIGGDNSDNQVIAGDGGSSMWGGIGGNDTLNGGAGYDEFFYVQGSGNDVVQGAGDNDVVNLLGVNLSQIVDAAVDESGVEATFRDGGKLRVEGNSNVGFKLEGTTFVANRSDGSWSTK